MSTPPPLFKHQKFSIKKLNANEIIFDMSDPGTGKTRVQIEDFAARRRKGGGPAFISAPKSLLQSAWGDDFKKYAPDMKISIAHASNREKAFAINADVYITNHDAVSSLAKKPPKFWHKFKKGTFITDESTCYKHRTSARSKAAKKIADYFQYKRLMSGTPNPKGVTDLWHQVFILDSGKRLGKSFFAFRAAVCEPTQTGPMPNMVEWTDKPHAEAAVSAMLSDIVIRHAFGDCVDIPPNHKYSVPFYMNKEHMAQYKELEAASILYTQKHTVTAINGASLHTKLLQLASGAVYKDPDNDESPYTLIDSDRYEMVLDMIEARKHTITFFYWKHQRDEMVKRAIDRGIDFAIIDGSVTRKNAREDIVSRYEAGNFQTLFAHPKSASHGLTLVKGSATIWPSPTSNLEWYEQGLKRIDRIGQTQKTETIVIVAPGTIEEAVYAKLQERSSKMTNLLHYLKVAA